MGTGLFLFSYKSVHYPCAVICWFNKIGDRPDEDTGMWKVRPSTLPNHSPHFVVICQVWVYSGRGSGQVRMKVDKGQRQGAGQEVSLAGVGDHLDSTTEDNER